MPKTVQIRDLDDAVYNGLLRRAAEAGVSVPELLRTEAARIAARPSMATWLDGVETRRSDRTVADTLEALDELRGEWPDADR